MTLIQKIMNFFTGGDNGESQRQKERQEADQRLNEYLAEKNRHDKQLQQKLFDELQARDPQKEQKNSDILLNAELKSKREQESNYFRQESQKIETKIMDKDTGSEDDIRNVRQEKEPEADLLLQRREEEWQRQHIGSEVGKKKREPAPLKHAFRSENERDDAEEQRRLDSIKSEEEQQKAEERRHFEEIANKERKRLEKERLAQIHSLYDEKYHDYLREVEIFRKEFGKNVKCDVCGKWEETELIVHRKQTYCQRCLPPTYDRTNERKVTAGAHGASKDFIKK